MDAYGVGQSTVESKKLTTQLTEGGGECHWEGAHRGLSWWWLFPGIYTICPGTIC